ncbi:MAG: CcoQ/FixQ family Cbb3-type cytochrome c oxidase assembly chaperone [Ferruginibacter sp.]
MFKFIKQYAETIKGADVYPMISLFIFFIFFVILLWYVKKMDKKNLHELSNIPLQDEHSNNLTGKNKI